MIEDGLNWSFPNVDPRTWRSAETELTLRIFHALIQRLNHVRRSSPVRNISSADDMAGKIWQKSMQSCSPHCLKSCPLSQTVFKISSCESPQRCHCYCSTIWLSVGGKQSLWSPFLKKCVWYKKFWTLLAFTSKKLEGKRVITTEKQKYNTGCLYVRGGPCTVPGGSSGEMSHHIRNLILKCCCHKKKVLLWLYSSTPTLFQKNKEPVL